MPGQVSYAFQTQRNFRIHVGVGALAIGLGMFFICDRLRCNWANQWVGSGDGVTEYGIESVVDLTVKQSYHELAKIARTVPGAVLVSSLAAVLVVGSLFPSPAKADSVRSKLEESEQRKL